MFNKKTLLVAAMLNGLLASNNTYAVESHLVYSPQNIPIFEIRFFDVGDGPFERGYPKGPESTWNLNKQQKEKILNAMRYWAELIIPDTKHLPATINVGTFDAVNAYGASRLINNSIISITLLEGILNGEDLIGSIPNPHAYFAMGKMDFDKVPYEPSQLPRTGKFDLVNTAIHELAHGLGIGNMVEDINGSNTPAFEKDPFNYWANHLRDDNGNPARPGQVILCDGCLNTYDPSGFDVREDQAYLVGENIDKVLSGSMAGIPVKMLGPGGSWVDDDYMSHSELRNSMMSHQNYCNYMTFMEAELALLQDMGYTIDRRNFFGFSLYNDGQTLYNHNGYFLRNPQGNAYVKGQYNTATLGLGLHVYGSNNRVYQLADLLTKGDGGAGIRIDGQNNSLSIEPKTRIYADGLNGNGIMFAYGKGHNLTQRGDVQAQGKGGVGIRFDFGDNAMGNEDEYRGSWIRTMYGYYDTLLPELEGALADRVDISGRVAGKKAAIYMSQNALVGNINILNGAQLEGGIYSGYNQKDANNQQRLTQLTFGLKADADGQATSAADPDFNFVYNGNISGINNLVLNTKGGKTSLNGDFNIYGMTIDKGAKLAGNGNYTLNANGLFINNGILSPGNSFGKVNITGNYQQGNTGQLLLETDGHGSHDTFKVDGHAQLDGQLTFAPQPDWYANTWQQNTNELLQINSHGGQFSSVNGVLSSPTLSLNIAPQETAVWQLSIQRAANAYSQYAQDNNAQQVGQILDKIVPIANTDIQPLYRALDFSSADGSGISNALSQLSPSSYSGMFASSLHREKQITRIIDGFNSSFTSNKLANNKWRNFAIPFGGRFWQQRQSSSVGYDSNSYGIVFGVETINEQNSNWVYGVHGAVSGQSLTVKAPESANGNGTAFNLGIHANYGAEKAEGLYLIGNARFGIEDASLDRNIHAGSYNANHHTSWTGISSAFTAGGGYRWALNDNMHAGLLTSLNYTTLHRPSVQESGTGGSQLRLNTKTFNSLQSSIAANINWNVPLATGPSITAELQFAWQHELLNNNILQHASFANYRNTAFSAKNKITARDALMTKVAMRYKPNAVTEFGIGIESELLRSGHHSIAGYLSGAWRF